MRGGIKNIATATSMCMGVCDMAVSCEHGMFLLGCWMREWMQHHVDALHTVRTMSAKSYTGYWGPATASVDWYALTHRVYNASAPVDAVCVVLIVFVDVMARVCALQV